MKLSLAETIKWTRIWGYVAIMLIFGIIAIKYHQGEFKPFVVQSGSMEPTVEVGSIVLTFPVTNVVVGDVITYRTSEGAVVTHRVAEILDEGTELMYVTKGDANEVNDSYLVASTMVIGKVTTVIPYLGKIINYSKTLPGYITFILIPALYLLIQGLLGFYHSFKSTDKHISVEVIAAISILLLGSVYSVNSSAAFFTAVDQSVGNTFSASESFGPAIAEHLVINEVLYDATQSQSMNGQGGTNRGQWVEIYNPTENSVNLTGWSLNDNSESEDLSGILGAGGYLIITGAGEEQFTTYWSNVPLSTMHVQTDDGTIGNGLANGGDRVELRNASNVLIDSMSWGTDTSGFISGCASACPTSPSGQSLERNPAGVDTNAAGNFVTQSNPSPGLAGF